MKAILLAAGVGKRLGGVHDGPKCLLEFAGRSLLERHFEALDAVGVDGVTLCLGHAAEAIVAAIPPRWRARTVVHYNPLYTLGSVVSLWCARQALASGDAVLVMDADVLYHRDILARLAASRQAGVFLIDRDFVPGDEPVKICLDGARIVEFRKRLPPDLRYTAIGESVGFFKFDAATALELAQRLGAYVADDRREQPHEETLRDLALDPALHIAVEDVTGLPWIEIDFPEDIARATQDILPRVDDATT
ncbi:MAG: phosphocholine cytidylyltransferase family protein [Gammaproteobacteria bacterium]|nr:phosphocholine cytidylyltransferase family protein [Gammaproteobacteria bacterium]